MSAADQPRHHLVERAAALLRDAAGFAANGPEPAAATGFRQQSEEPAASISKAPALTVAQLQSAGLVLHGARSRATEEFRLCAGRLVRTLRGLRGGAANLVMVTSSRPGEGKSFTCMNMAASIAQNGIAEVLLIDCDGKPFSISALLGRERQAGLYDLAADAGMAPAPLALRTDITGLSILPVGQRAPDFEAGVSGPVLSAIQRTARAFPHHVVLLDAAPCLSTSDPSTLAQIADVALLVVQAERTQRSEIESSFELIQHCSQVTLMLNQARQHGQASFGSYYYGSPE